MDKAKSTAKRDHLQSIEVTAQNFWKENRTNESDPDSRPKYMMTFPYPYMNGKLHLGHGFSASKNEFAARFKRLQGYNVLWPFGFHCTGTPINASCDRLTLELNKFGDASNDMKTISPETLEEDSKKEKPEIKWYNNILKMGIAEDQIHSFTDSNKWLEYFPPMGMQDLAALGYNVDWRRSMITTDRNKFYDKFVKWQFNTLKKNDHLGYGKRPCIYSPTNGQPCMDHDRTSGEGVGTQEFTLIKMKVLKTGAKFCEKISPKIIDCPKDVFLVAATLRPETMFGQTNCFVLPEGEYLAVETKEGEVWIVGANAAKNLSYQDKLPVYGKVDPLFTILGTELIGTPVKAPLCPYDYVYTLPMPSILLDRCTGVVTSVPSDSPDDYIMFKDIKEKEKIRTDYGIELEMLDRELIDIIEVPELGQRSAEFAINQFKVKSHKDKALLKQAKDLAYKKGFEDGTMIAGEFKGEPVKSAKLKTKKILLDSKQGELYYEPESQVIARNGDVCCVAYVDQWYMKYGEGEWNTVLNKYLKEKFKTYNDQTKNEFEYTANWLSYWACSRTYGLGSRFPWDDKFVIESLSDSTIYWAYYLVKHYLHSDINGDTLGSLNLQADELDDAFFTYIFNNSDDASILNERCAAQLDLIKRIKSEFTHYYPIDLRCSGKDLIRNHLTMAMYNHIGVWGGDRYLPKSYYCNGYVLVDNKKMSKNEGNFFTVEDVIKLFGADATRIGFADCGDTHEDANFQTEVCNKAILRMSAFEAWFDEMVKNDDWREESHVYDKIFQNETLKHLNAAYQLYDMMKFKLVLKEIFYELMDLKEEWLNMTKKPSKSLFAGYVRDLLVAFSPIAPHWTHHLWTKLKQFNESASTPLVAMQPYIYHSDPTQCQQWNDSDYDLILARQRVVLFKTMSSMRSMFDNCKKKAKTPLENCALIGTKVFPEEHKKVIAVMKSMGLNDKNMVNGNIFNELKAVFEDKKVLNNAVKFAKYWEVNEIKIRGVDALEDKVSYDEIELYKSLEEYIKTQLGLKHIHIIDIDNQQEVEGMPKVKGMYDNVLPEKPNVTFW